MAAPVRPHAHELEIVEVIKETPDTVSLVFEVPPDLVDRFAYLPGQFLTLRVPSERAGSVARCYSLSSSPHLDDCLIVTVKRTASGYASNWLCDNAAAGMTLTVLPPSGTFHPRSLDADLLLCGAGSGITPLLSIAKSALVAGTGEVVLLDANRDPESVIFAGELADIAVEFRDRFGAIHWLESERGLPTAERLLALLEPFAGHEAFLCGPAGFMDAVRDALRVAGTPSARVHTEVFQSLTRDPFAEISLDEPLDAGESATAVVDLDGAQLTVEWPRHRPLLEAMLQAGIDAPYSCREAMCCACACTVVDGEVRMAANEALAKSDVEQGVVLACQALPVSDVVKVVYDR